MKLRYDADLPLARTLEWTFRKRVKGGWYLARGDFEVFMTEKEAGTEAASGQTLDAFVYRDSEGRLTARRRPAVLSMGEIGHLTVVEVGPLGAFLDWGLPKHLLLPKSECLHPPRPRSQVLVRLLLDEENRPTATQRIWESLEPPPEDLSRGRPVFFCPLKTGRYGIQGALDARWRGFLHVPGADLPTGKSVAAYFLGRDHQARGRITLLDPSPEGRRAARDQLLELAEKHGGVLPLNKDSPAELIWRHLRWSKNEFKAVLESLPIPNDRESDPSGIGIRKG